MKIQRNESVELYMNKVRGTIEDTHPSAGAELWGLLNKGSFLLSCFLLTESYFGKDI